MQAIFKALVRRLNLGRPATRASRASAEQALIERAGVAARARHYPEAIRLYRSVLEARPGDPGLTTQLGNMLKDNGDPEGALRIYRQALEAEPRSADLWLQTGHALKLTGDLAAAQEAYERAALIEPDNAGARAELDAAGLGRNQARRLADLAGGRGSERSFTLAWRLERLEAELAALRADMDAVLTLGHAPPSRYDLFAERHPLPPPREIRRSGALHLVAAEDEMQPAALHDLVAAAHALQTSNWRIWAGAPEDDVRRYAAAEPRIALGAGDEAAAAAEAGDWILHLEGARPGPLLGAWLAWAGAETEADAFVFDEIVENMDEKGEATGPAGVLLRAGPDAETLASRPGPRPHARRAGVGASLQDLAAAGRLGHIPLPLLARPARPHPPLAPGRSPALAGAPASLTVIIPTKDNAEMAERFLETLERRTSSPERVDYLIIDNGPGAAAASGRMRAGPRRRVIEDPSPFNWSLLNNRAAEAASGDALLFANDDMLMLSEGWDVRILAQLARPEIGVVGARLLFPNDTVQHAGVRLGWRGGSIHEGLGAGRDEPGPDARWITPRRASAVTGAFLAVRAPLFHELGGFDAQLMPVSHSDLDFCLKSRAAGLAVLYDPLIELYHFESVSRGLDAVDPAKQARFDAEKRAFEDKWGAAARHEPGLNPFWADYNAPYAFLRQPATEAIEDYIRSSAVMDIWAI